MPNQGMRSSTNVERRTTWERPFDVSCLGLAIFCREMGDGKVAFPLMENVVGTYAREGSSEREASWSWRSPRRWCVNVEDEAFGRGVNG